MEIVVARKGKSLAILACQGSLDASTVDDFKRSAQGLCDDGVRQLILDGSGLDFIDSVGLGALLALKRRLREHAGDVRLAALSSDVQSIFEITRLHRHFEICTTTDEACQRFAVTTN
ncbi:MAG: STAS domain-containing protein [Deltaproteobacteria bacterium]|nr:STAS domain-containing protein [Deltaproteobacteria bacterium]